MNFVEEKSVPKKVSMSKWKLKQASMMWGSLIETQEVTRLIEEADEIGHCLILKMLGHCLNKGMVHFY
jgi:hypothetical protein